MKKIILSAVIVFCLSGILPLAAASYDNNEFQRKSRAYTEKATIAYDEGDYDLAIEYAKEAEKNADLSVAFIEKAILRAETETLLYTAHTRLSWARDKKAEKFFPNAYLSASEAVASGDSSFASEEYEDAKGYAQNALDALLAIREITPLPAFYEVDLWAASRDCLWNIAANPAIYGNPLLWEELYRANKNGLKQPSNPNLLMPGMIVTIPSIRGEFREGIYDSSIKYESLKSQEN